MSGEKRAQIAFGNWYRQRIRQPVIRAVNAATQAAIRAGVTTLHDAEVADLRRRQEATETVVREMSERGRDVEQAIAARLAEHAARVEAVRASTTAMRGELLQAIADSEQQVRSALAQEARAREDQISRLKEALSDVTEGRRRAREAAEEYLHDCHCEQALIASGLPHERFAPGQLSRLTHDVQQVENYLQQGIPEAALVRAHDTYESLCALRVDVDLRHREWLRLRREAMAALEEQQALVQENETLELQDDSGQKPATVSISVDRWTNGGLDALRKRVDQALDQVRNAPGPADDLRTTIQETAPAFERHLHTLVAEAQDAVTASQRRAQIAALVTQALNEGFAYELGPWGYTDGDERRAIFARLVHDSDNEILVEVSPSLDGDPQLRLMSFDADMTAEALRQQRMDAVNAHLVDHHLIVGPVQSRATPDITDVPSQYLPEGLPGRTDAPPPPGEAPGPSERAQQDPPQDGPEPQGLG